jgi:RHS repeat-associated protein
VCCFAASLVSRCRATKTTSSERSHSGSSWTSATPHRRQVAPQLPGKHQRCHRLLAADDPPHAGMNVFTPPRRLWTQSGSYTTGNRITAFGDCSYLTDSTGNVTSRRCTSVTDSLIWSADGRLSSVTRNGVTTAFAYDPAGRLVRRDSAGSTVSNFLWDGDNLLAELGPGGDSTRSEYSYYPGLDNLHAFAYRYGGLWNTAFAHRDALGNIRGLAEGVTTYRVYDYDEWGNDLGTVTGAAGLGELDRARWKGSLYLAPEAGLYYMRNRWYEPWTGRFLSEDPLGLGGGINPYGYANDDPIGGIDPLGLCGGKKDGPCPLSPIGVSGQPAPPLSPYDVRNGGDMGCSNAISNDRDNSPTGVMCRAILDDQRNYQTPNPTLPARQVFQQLARMSSAMRRAPLCLLAVDAAFLDATGTGALLMDGVRGGVALASATVQAARGAVRAEIVDGFNAHVLSAFNHMVPRGRDAVRAGLESAASQESSWSAVLAFIPFVSLGHSLGVAHGACTR